MIDDRPDLDDSDELDELARVNPIRPEALQRVFAVDRRSLIDMLEADAGRPAVHRLTRLPSTRVRYVAATTAVAAAAAIVALFIGGSQLPNEPPNNPPNDPVSMAVADEAPNETSGESTDQSPANTRALRPDLDSHQTGNTGIADDRITSTTEAPEPTTTIPTRVDGGFDTSLDLLSLHYDHSHLDDGHSAAAAKELTSWFGVDALVVAGTYRDGYDGWVNDYGPVMDAIWGNGWLDAQADRAVAVDATVARWLASLDAGGHIWVAEGGVSDFTATVVDRVQQQRPGLDTTAAIHVVQHSNRNESETTPSRLTFVKANTDYQRIADGNSANDTADLNQRDDGFRDAALAGSHRDAWVAAFDYHPVGELDFSDTVEVLHILGVGVDEVANPADFADRFLR